MTNQTDIHSSDTGKLNPFITHSEFFGQMPTLRRLFVVRYCCPLCGQEHEAETSVAHTTDSLDELHAHARACLHQSEVALPLLGQHIFLLHNDRGDYRNLREDADSNGPKGPLKLISITMTAEDELTCEDCAHRSQSIGDLNEHIGINPWTMARMGPPQCMADY